EPDPVVGDDDVGLGQQAVDAVDHLVVPVLVLRHEQGLVGTEPHGRPADDPLRLPELGQSDVLVEQAPNICERRGSLNIVYKDLRGAHLLSFRMSRMSSARSSTSSSS